MTDDSVPRREDLHFPPKDVPLKDDVRILGALVGDVIREQGGEELFERVETARRAAIRRREAEARGDGGADGELFQVVRSLDSGEAELLVRSFSTYFQVVNLAEKVHRIRRRRDYLRARSEEEGPQKGSLRDTARRLRDAGLDLEDVLELLEGLSVEPVFTAHPTEATRRTVLEKHQRIARRLVERLDPSLTPPEERSSLGEIRAEVTAAWQTEEQPRERPSVADEADRVLFYVTDVLFRTMPPFYEELQEALDQAYGEETYRQVLGSRELPTLVRFASWVGGDMDGNPNVTAETLEATLERHRQLVLDLHRGEVRKLAGRLTQSLGRVEVDRGILERAREYRALFPDTADSVPNRHRDMPYRVLLELIAARLEATARDEASGYRGAEIYVADLEAIAASLERHKGRHAGLFAARRALVRARTFGFHLATLDVRQDAGLHRRVMGRLLGDEDWQERPPGERTERLRRALVEGEEPREPEGGWAGEEVEGDGPRGDDSDWQVARTLEVFRTLARIRRRLGPRAVGPYVLSMARAADDVLATLLLARWGGLVEGGSSGGDGAPAIPLDVVPLFETVDDLERAPEVMAGLLQDELYRRHLERRGDRQTLMLGYSDSSKDGGVAASRWALQTAQERLVATFEGSGVTLTFFHGRGGTVGRGGGKTHRAVRAAPAGSVAGRLRMTEQGEVIDDKYGLRGIALRTLERTVGATALATAGVASPEPRREHWKEVMGRVAEVSRQTYRRLVYDDPDFPAYFRQATPIDVIERMMIGSRPASRRPEGGIESLRAIPWVFAWTQSRHMLPGWYGLGSGLEAAREDYGAETLRAMAGGWPFFRNLLDDAEMVLAKSDLGVARRYARLAGEAGDRLFPVLAEEHRRTAKAILELGGTAELLDRDPTLQRSIRLRNPYVDPMSLLQLDLLERWRAEGRQEPRLLSALLTTVHGIAQGLQNTG